MLESGRWNRQQQHETKTHRLYVTSSRPKERTLTVTRKKKKRGAGSIKSGSPRNSKGKGENRTFTPNCTVGSAWGGGAWPEYAVEEGGGKAGPAAPNYYFCEAGIYKSGQFAYRQKTARNQSGVGRRKGKRQTGKAGGKVVGGVGTKKRRRVSRIRRKKNRDWARVADGTLGQR